MTEFQWYELAAFMIGAGGGVILGRRLLAWARYRLLIRRRLARIQVEAYESFRSSRRPAPVKASDLVERSNRRRVELVEVPRPNPGGDK